MITEKRYDVEYQKITVISFDHWNYDEFIVKELTKKGIDAHHIKISAFKHKNILEKVKNSGSKIFLNKNPKLKKRQEYILKSLKKIGYQDQILIINPELIDLEYHLEIKKYTNKYSAYLYDSVARCPVNHLLNGVFDTIYSFDKNDIKQYGFRSTNNYNYIDNETIDKKITIQNDVLYIASFDNRMKIVQDFKSIFTEFELNFRFIIIGKKTFLFKLKNLFSNKIKGLELRKKRINNIELLKLYTETKVVLDIVRENQVGLSFRVFEAMALEKKLITNNATIKEFDFYNPNNILVIDEKMINIEKKFFETNYEPIDKKIFDKYTISSWVDNVFELTK